MSNYLNTVVEVARPLTTTRILGRYVMIAVALAAVAGTFACLGGWLTPNDLTPARFADGFEQVNGVHPGFRRNHAKGVGVSGYFESNGNGVRLSEAIVFRSGRVPVIGRFSLGGGLPHAVDTPESVRGLGLEFSLPNGEQWRTAMLNLPVFPFSTPGAFYEQMIASKPDPKTGKPDSSKMSGFLARHPETEQALSVIKNEPVTSGFHNNTFHTLTAFRFNNSAGATIPVRLLLTPLQPFEASNASIQHDKNYLFDALIAKIHQQPLRWHLLVIIGQPGDATNDASIAWPAEREKVDVGTLTLDQVEPEEASAATTINFDPLVLPAGIASSDDPLLSARSAVYSQSLTRRAGETKQPSAITVTDVHKGE